MEIKSDEPASIVEETTPSFVVPKKELYTEDVLNAMNKYYKLKSDYEKKYKKTVKNIANNDLTSLAKKRRLISSIKPKCVKCKRDVGTIFSNKDRVLTAKCGDTITPCGLDIQIHRGSVMSESKAADYWQNEIENEKLNIIQTKLDFLFGFVSEEDLKNYYHHAALVAYPSLYEGFGLPPLEAMACGTPVVTSTSSSLPEVVGDAAIKVNPYSVTDLCEAMASILLDKKKQEELTQKGKKQVRKFTWEKTARRVLGYYHEVHKGVDLPFEIWKKIAS